MPNLPHDYRPVPGLPAPPQLSSDAVSPTLPPPEEPKVRPATPRVRDWRPKDAKMLEKLSIFKFQPDQRLITEQMLGDRRHG